MLQYEMLMRGNTAQKMRTQQSARLPDPTSQRSPLPPSGHQSAAMYGFELLSSGTLDQEDIGRSLCQKMRMPPTATAR